MADLSLYSISIPPFIRHLNNLEAFLKKGQTWAKDNNVPEEQLLTTRLAPDQQPLPYQIYRLTDSMKFTPSRLSTNIESPSMPDTETTFPELYARINKTREFLQSIPKDAFDGLKPGQEIVWKAGGGSERRMSAMDYLLAFALPNVAFHVTTAYAILRHVGVPVGKLDYLGSFTK